MVNIKKKRKIKFLLIFSSVFFIFILLLSIIIVSAGYVNNWFSIKEKQKLPISKLTPAKQIKPTPVIPLSPASLKPLLDSISKTLKVMLNQKLSVSNSKFDDSTNYGVLGLLNAFSLLFNYQSKTDEHNNYCTGLSLMLLNSINVDVLKLPGIGVNIDIQLNQKVQKALNSEFYKFFDLLKQLLITDGSLIISKIFSTLGINLQNDTIKSDEITKISAIFALSPKLIITEIENQVNSDKTTIGKEILTKVSQINQELQKSNFFQPNTDVKTFLFYCINDFISKIVNYFTESLYPTPESKQHALSVKVFLAKLVSIIPKLIIPIGNCFVSYIAPDKFWSHNFWNMSLFGFISQYILNIVNIFNNVLKIKIPSFIRPAWDWTVPVKLFQGHWNDWNGVPYPDYYSIITDNILKVYRNTVQIIK